MLLNQIALKAYERSLIEPNTTPIVKSDDLANEFSIDEIRSQPVTQIPWGTLVTVIMPKSSSHEEMLWYINETHKNG